MKRVLILLGILEDPTRPPRPPRPPAWSRRWWLAVVLPWALFGLIIVLIAMNLG